MTMKPTPPFAGKAQWHAQQRQLPPREKIRILIELQRREVESNGIRRSLGPAGRRDEALGHSGVSRRPMLLNFADELRRRVPLGK